MDDIIYAYTWDDAVADGTKIVISGLAKSWGWTVPVAVTSNLFNTHLRVGVEGKGEDELLTNNNIISLLHCASAHAKKAPEGESMITFDFRINDRFIKVWACMEARSPDNPEPVVTFMLPEDY